MKNLNYIKFVVSKVEHEFLGFSNSREYVKVITVLHALKITDNLLRDIYILSGIKKLRQLSAYLIFMLKKIESGSINIDNFIENYSTDKNFISSYFQTYYDLEQITPEEFVTEEVETKFILDTENSSAVNPVYSLAESNFKVADLDNELVTEEFRDTSINENFSEPGDAYLKLVEEESNSDNSDMDNSVYFTDISEDVFSLPGQSESKDSESNDEISYSNEEEIINKSNAVDNVNILVDSDLDDNSRLISNSGNNDGDTENINLADFFEKLDSETSFVNNEAEHITPVVIPEDSSQEQTLLYEDKISGNTFLETRSIDNGVYASEEISTGNEIDENEILKSLMPAIPVKNNIPEDDESSVIKTDSEVEEKLNEIEKETSAEILNSEFIAYEKFLYEKNKILYALFDDLILIFDSSDPELEMRDLILEEVLVILSDLKNYSEKMSFEVITGIYDSMMYCFDIKFKDVLISKENIQVFTKALNGVEDLIKGNELTGFDVIISKLNSLKDELAKLLADRENFEKKKYDFGEEESNLIKEFKDSSEYDAYIILRDKISELEETFQIIADMKDKTYPFESIRKLSVTFALFREIVNISRILEMNKIAYLAEAGYIFVKFVQNYRIDPFKQEVSEVFKYLIYSFKLIYLDKPVKDFDTFVSFLNDPVKIFYPKNKNNE